ncbi:MAG: hypothetical protein KID00_13210 [Clostridium argentinense]|uniref:Uncharacterized protein n=1 Tax=Clostridium faecium TaxID=2762223 RepID=A0ABR8YTU2_9CLOT|nr:MULTISPECIES: hypothetical protein [Clostridium]MBD8047408.1 hypothetical protein [Clostridium faecium]MBS5824784.1 hypothetical protein [Clostridium argentinense]MDU1349796.1 hypothetical protein [Clostridium argentinense]
MKKKSFLILSLLLIIVIAGNLNYMKLVKDNKIMSYHNHKIKSESKNYGYNKSYELRCKCDDKILKVDLHNKR